MNYKDNFLLEFEDLEKLSIGNLLDKIKESDGKPLNEFRLMDLSYHNGNQINPGIGVYIFRREKEIVLVGKVSSMSFTERIGKHLDFRHGAWFNRLLILICERQLNIKVNDENLRIASKYAFDNLNLILINFKNRERINRTERLLRSCTNTLNKFRNLKESNLEKIVKDY